MAGLGELDEITQKILLEGDEEVISQLEKIGEVGLESFNKFNEAIESGKGGFEAFAGGLVNIGAAAIAAGAALTSFVNEQDEAIQKTQFLGDAFGSTTAQISGIEAAFAQAGVSSSSFEQFAQRLTTTIAREWPAITESIRTSSREQSQAQVSVVESTLKVQEAQQNLATVSEKSGETIEASALRLQEAYRALQFSAQEAANAATDAINSVANASLGVEAAEQRLATLQGRPPSAAEQKNLQLKQAEQAVTDALTRQEEARLKQQEQSAAAADKQRKLQDDVASAALKHSTDIQNALNAQRQAQVQVTQATNAQAEAQEREAKVALGSIPSITTALGGLGGASKETTNNIDLTQVSVQNLVKSFISLASSGGAPTGLQVMSQLSKTLSEDTNHLISDQQRLAIVQQLSQRGFNTTGAAASELLHVLEQGPKAFTDLDNAASKAYSNTKPGLDAVEEERKAFEKFSFQVQLTNRDLAAFASPAVTAFLEGITASLTESGGLLHTFVDGIKGIGDVVVFVRDQFTQLFEKVNNALGTTNAGFATFRGLLVGASILIVAFATPFLAIPVAIAAIVVAAGLLYQNFDKIKAKAIEIWEGFKDSSVVKFIEGVISSIIKLITYLDKILGIKDPLAKDGGQGQSGGGSGTTAAASTDAPITRAEGGPVFGAGTKTSDSIPAYLSHGEYVQKAAAVDFWGSDFMHAINNMTFPGFAQGGLVPAPVRMIGGSGGSGQKQAQSVLNLTIGDKTFGLQGAADTVRDLGSYATSQRTSSAGRKPSWNS